MKTTVLIMSIVVLAAGLAIFATLPPPAVEHAPLADHVPASAVVYIGIADTSGPRTELVERLLGPDRVRELGRYVDAGVETAAIYAVLENGQLQWHALGRIHGSIVQQSWSGRPAPSGPRLGARPDFRAAWGERRANTRVWIDLHALGLTWPTDDFRALALDVHPSSATGHALYAPGAYAAYLEKCTLPGRTGVLPEGPFSAAGTEKFEHIARRLNLDDRFPFDVLGPTWGCELRGGELVVFVEASHPEHAREAMDRIGKSNYRYVDGWCLWASDARALDGFVPGVTGREQAAIHFTSEAAADLERLAVRYGRRLPIRLAALGAFDATLDYQDGMAGVKIQFRKK